MHMYVFVCKGTCLVCTDVDTLVMRKNTGIVGNDFVKSSIWIWSEFAFLLTCVTKRIFYG